MIVDKIGQEIKAGDYIAYGHALGRCAGLRLGRVVATPKQDRITIWGVDGEWSHRPKTLLSKRSTLMYPNRIIVLDPAKVPDDVKKLLEVVEIDEV